MTYKYSHQTAVNTIVTSQAQILTLKLRNGKIYPEYSRNNYVSRQLRLHNATLRNNPTNKPRKTTHRSKTSMQTKAAFTHSGIRN